MKRKNAGCRKWIMGAAVLALSSASGFVNHASAQPQQREAIPNWQNMTPEQLEDTLQNLTPEQQEGIQQMLQFLTPNQRQQMLQALPADQREKTQQMFEQAQVWLQKRVQQQRWDWIRQTLVASGYTDATVQAAVIEFMQAQEKARQPLRATAHELTNLLINPDTTEDEFQKQLGAFQEKMKKDEERANKELTALDEKIKYSTNPRLKTLLIVLGIVGQETPTLGGLATLFPESPFANIRAAG